MKRMMLYPIKMKDYFNVQDHSFRGPGLAEKAVVKAAIGSHVDQVSDQRSQCSLEPNSPVRSGDYRQMSPTSYRGNMSPARLADVSLLGMSQASQSPYREHHQSLASALSGIAPGKFV